MDSCLYGIQDTAIQIADTISKMLQVDVEIIDENHMRVAGTGRFRNQINKSNLEEGHEYHYVFETGNVLIVENPGTDEVCKDCRDKNTCRSTFEIGTPILMKNRIIGIIGAICCNDDRREFFKANLEDCLYFMRQMAELIEGKVAERNTLQRHLSVSKMLNTTMQKMEKGVIVLDYNNKITSINDVAKKELKLTDTWSEEYINVIVTGDTITGKREFKIVIKAGSSTVVGDYEIIDSQDEHYSKILIFDSIQEYRNQVYYMTHQVLPHDINSIIGKSQHAGKLKEEIRSAAQNNGAVLITGEHGTGKKMTATAIWKSSSRSDKPFVYFNCSSVQEELLEETLFGTISNTESTHKHGKRGHIGSIELAHEGILFLDEIEALPLYFQTKLETVIDEKAFQRKGSLQKIPVNVRIIAATSVNLVRRVNEDKFRKGLYFKTSVIKIHITPIRERSEDIEELVRYYIEVYAKKYQANVQNIEPEVMELLENHAWLGNVSELENTIEYMVNSLGENTNLMKETLPKEFKYQETKDIRKILTLEEVEYKEICKALEQFGETKKGKEKAADALGIGIATLYRRLDRMN